MSQKTTDWYVDGRAPIAYITGTKNFWDMMALVGIHGNKLMDKSMKMKGVPKAMHTRADGWQKLCRCTICTILCSTHNILRPRYQHSINKYTC